MIRIDEIYYNVFVKGLQHQKNLSLHWFDPFGSVKYEDMCSVPKLDWGQAERRLVFWDQEPVYRDTADDFFNKFAGDTPGLHYDGMKTIVTSEINSKDLDWLCDTYQLDRAYYFFHGWAALDWYRGYNYSFLRQPWHQQSLKYPLFIPNNIIGGRRNHRIQLLAALSERRSVEMNLISFPEICPYENVSAYQLAEELDLDISNLKLPLTIDDNDNHAGHSSRIDFWDQAQECFCHVVTETAWSDRTHITEKTFKPIVMQQPFILVGSKNGLAYLRDYGFKTFGDIWDESYDKFDDSERMQKIADLCAEISHWTPGQLQDAHYQVQKTVKHNLEWFYSGFQDLLWQELNTMMEAWR